MSVTSTTNVERFDETNFESAVLKSDTPVLVDFYADWCGPCRQLGPTIDEVARVTAATARVGKLNVDEAPAVAARYGVSSIPTVIVFRGGEVVDRLVGIQPQDRYTEALANAGT